MAKLPKKTTFHDVDQLFALSYTCRKMHNECAALPLQYNKVRFVLDIEESSGPIRSNSPPHKELRRIAKRQAERGELKPDLIIDIGCIQGGPHDRLNPFHTFMQRNQRELRALHKGTKSLALAFDIGGVALPSTTGHKMESYKWIPCEIVLHNPESIGVQLMRQLASEMSYIGKPQDMRSATARLIRIFWPVYAVRNGIQ
ncbi:hypothetical protein HII31_03375 [Pseudocercospora fuligena]|uniref:Uncharacterized protein n=1 Tax=Pseudocercospora fuligena TaxID=685502 RepID=A0A8H6RQ69_9PEZI|nr:hypothetical protein HII31_03375 [Pseudocercospora fuligena]